MTPLASMFLRIAWLGLLYNNIVMAKVDVEVAVNSDGSLTSHRLPVIRSGQAESTSPMVSVAVDAGGATSIESAPLIRKHVKDHYEESQPQRKEGNQSLVFASLVQDEGQDMFVVHREAAGVASVSGKSATGLYEGSDSSADVEDSIVHEKIPSDEELAEKEADVLITKPEPCDGNVVAETCAAFAVVASGDDSVSAEEVSKVTAISLKSMEAFFAKAGLSELRPTCRDLCSAALTLIPAEARPAKTFVAGRRWRSGGRIYWDVDVSPDALGNLDETFDRWSADERGKSEDIEKREDNELALEDDGSEELSPVGVASEVCELFGLFPFVNSKSGALMQMGNNVTTGKGYWEQGPSRGCKYSKKCYCEPKDMYGPHAQFLFNTMRAWLNQAKRNRYMPNGGTRWAPVVFKTGNMNPALVRRISTFFNMLLDLDVHVCINMHFHENPAAPRWFAYTLGAHKFYYTMHAWRRDTALEVLTWFHEVAHMMPLGAIDVQPNPYGWRNNQAMNLADSMQNADSYELYVARVIGRDMHYSNSGGR